MKMIGITQRIDVISNYEEKRDSLDRRWYNLCMECNLFPILIPNHLLIVLSMLENINLSGFILTGGNNLNIHEKDAPERNEVELLLIQHAIHRNIPILGVCRGMQLLQHYFKIPLYKIKGHVGIEHSIFFRNERRKVNSYHKYGTNETVSQIQVIAKAEDNMVEAIQHKDFSIKGIMWHPERNFPFDPLDIKIITQTFR